MPTAWTDIVDNNATPPGPQGFPFDVVGSILTGVNEVNANNSVSVYPNPMTTSATVFINNYSLSSVESYTFVLYDILGNVVRKIEQVQDKQFTIQRESLNQGVYFYEMLKGNSSLKKGKLIIQ